MNFENPVWLYWTPLIALAAAGLIVFGRRRRNALLQQFAATRLLEQLTEKADFRRILVKGVLIVLAFCMIGIALARPQYGVDFVERKARGLDIVFVLDSSKSMLATDLRPTRLERAKLATMDLVNQLESDRIGLVVFAGNAFLQTPPTLDYSAFRENLNSVTPGSISRGGSNIGQALREAAKAFPKDNNFKIVILMTDGEDLEEQAIEVAREIAKDDIKVYSIGIGTPEGTYLKVRNENGNEEFVRDSSGQPVRSRLDEKTLQKISQLTDGSYSRLAGQSLERLYNSVLATLPREEREFELQETRIERYQWALFIAIVCLITETLIRRRKNVSVQMLAAFAFINLITPTPSYAEQSFDEAVEEITPKELSEDSRVIYNRAHSSLIAGDYAGALDLYETAIELSDDVALEQNSLYNMAHANNQLGEQALQAKDYEAAIDYWKQAEALFKSANELNSNDQESLEDAHLVNSRRKLLEDFLEQQQKQSQDNKSESDQNQKDSETNSDKDKQDKNESSREDSSDEKETSQQEKPSPEQESSDDNNSNSEPSASENGSDEKSSKNQADDDKSTESPEAENKGDPNTESESTGNPTEDIQEQYGASESEQSEENDAETEKKDRTIQKKSEKNTTAEGTSKAVTVPEGMNMTEAQRLLDSLQSSERLLPFTEPSDRQGKTRETRDW